VRAGGFWVRFWTARHSRKLWLAGRNVPRAARDVPAPKERGVICPVNKSISVTLSEFNDFVPFRSGLVRNPG
jgi:hypothetical protein